jgi:TRAP-type transport system small permease protein
MEKIREAGLRLVTIVNKGLLSIAITLMVVLVVIVFSSVISRYFLNSSIAWAEEISRFILIWMVFIGAVLAYANKEHLGLDIVVDIVPRKAGKILRLLADVAVFYALTLVINGGYKLTVNSMDSLTPALEIPSGYMYLIVPIAGVLMAIITVADAWRQVSEIREGGK